jgi:hypothetical protein
MLTDAPRDDTWQLLGELALSSESDHEHPSVDQVVGTLRGLDLPVTCLERLEQSVTQAIRNAMQHGNQYGPEAPVLIRVLVSNIEARRIERQSPGGWGFFLIERTTQASSDLAHRAIELFVYREGGKNVYKSG